MYLNIICSIKLILYANTYNINQDYLSEIPSIENVAQ